jgi:hypothetical protein
MTIDANSWSTRGTRLGRSDLVTQMAVLLPVVVFAGLAAPSMVSSPLKATPQSVSQAISQTVGRVARIRTAAAAAPQQESALMLDPAPAASSAAPAGQAVANGLKISSQSWRRGGLGSKALITFTLRNDNAYAVKDIEIGCAFSRRDGSHLTDRRRVIPNAVVETKSRKTFARMLIGFVNIDANTAKCAPVAANRV